MVRVHPAVPKMEALSASSKMGLGIGLIHMTQRTRSGPRRKKFSATSKGRYKHPRIIAHSNVMALFSGSGHLPCRGSGGQFLAQFRLDAD